MAETKDCLIRPLDGGKIIISSEVVASVAACAVREVEGVYALSMTPAMDLAAILSGKNLRKGIMVAMNGEEVAISCNLIIKLGESVMTVAKNVQEAIANEVETMTGVRPTQVNVNISGIAAPKAKK